MANDRSPAAPRREAESSEPTRPMVARLTADGRSAIAVIGVFGMSEAEFRVRFDAARPTPILVGQVRYGSWSSSETVPGESVVVTRTGDVGWEIHCHGGRAAVRAILDSLVLVGAVEVDAEVWRRAEAARLGTPLAVVEAESCLLRCQTVDDAACVLDQVRGALVDWARHWHDAIDNGDVATGDWQAAAETVLQRAPASEKILRSRRVVLFGPPNVGKSSLINQIMGVGRSIVHEVAGTTRDVLDSATVLGGVPVTLSDTAGLRETGDAIEREGVRRARLAIGGADLVVLVVDPSTRDQAAQLWREIDEHAANTPVVRVLNQADRLDAVGGDGEEDWIKTVAGPGDVDSFSAVGINELIEVIARTLADQRPPRDVALPMTARQIAVLERLAACRTSESVLVLLDELIGGEDGALS